MPALNATAALIRAITTHLGDGASIAEIESRPWASVTFSGARHALTLRLEGTQAAARADTFLADLDLAEFTLRGHILADVALIAREDHDEGHVRLRLEALTVED